MLGVRVEDPLTIVQILPQSVSTFVMVRVLLLQHTFKMNNKIKSWSRLVIQNVIHFYNGNKVYSVIIHKQINTMYDNNSEQG